MNSFNNLNEEEKLFFNNYFWNVNSHSEQGENKKKSCEVRPFLHSSKKFYWEKAYLAYLRQQTIQDKAAIAAEVTMDVVYTVCNAFNAVAPVIHQVAQAIPVVGISWNLIDAGGAFVLAVRDGKKQDSWSQGINLLAGIQLTAGTVTFTLLNYSEVLHIGISTSVAVSAIAAGTSGFAFAAAMFFSWALAHREVKLHRARIDYLNNKIKEIEVTINREVIDNYKDAKNEEEKITSLETFVAQEKSQGAQSQPYKDLLELIKFSQHQQQQLENHERARRAWGLCAVFMTALAIVAVAVIALGISASTCGMMTVAVASCMALLGSALYRHKPAVFDKTAKAIQSNIHGFFQPKPINQHQNDDLSDKPSTTPSSPPLVLCSH